MVWAEPRPAHVRIRLYPQSPRGGPSRLETVSLSPRRGEVRPGPADARMYAIEAPGKPPYGRGDNRLLLPPWRGPVAAPVPLGPDGDLDHLRPGDPGFRCVHLYGCVRYALDVWERHAGGPIPWHFAQDFDRLELVTLRGWDNAQMGYGYLEAGERLLDDGRIADLALDFDVIAHEVGHALLLAFGGSFRADRVTPDYEALHEASADWAAIIAALHFDALLEDLLETTAGDLDSFNRLNRFAEFSASHEVRIANNDRTMWDFATGWQSEHELSLPLLAALWDSFVEVYNELLVAHGAIPRALERLAERAEVDRALRVHVAREFQRAFLRRPEPFYAALRTAREIAAVFLLNLWRQVDPADFRLEDIAGFLEETDQRVFSGRLRRLVAGSLASRGVGVVPPGPRLGRPGRWSHVHSARTATPDEL
jgi:hypothetical protein